MFDALCDEVKEWSRFYYGRKLISYSILKELIADGWTKTEKK